MHVSPAQLVKVAPSQIAGFALNCMRPDGEIAAQRRDQNTLALPAQPRLYVCVAL